MSGVAGRPRGRPCGGHKAALLVVLQGAAESGLPCPGNRQLMDALGLAHAARVSELLAALKGQGVIRVFRQRGGGRVVEIVASGAATAAGTRQGGRADDAPPARANGCGERGAGAVSPGPGQHGPGARFTRCQWIDGAPTADDGCKCGAPVRPGSSWCETHHARVWLPLPPDWNPFADERDLDGFEDDEIAVADRDA